MCGCAGNTPCGYHADLIMEGLADSRDLSDRGDTVAAEQVMTRLRLSHGEAKVRFVMDEIQNGRRDLSVYGSTYPRSN